MEFDLQEFLRDMDQRSEVRSQRIENKIDSCLKTVADHETRVSIIEQTPPSEHETRIVRVEGFIKNTRWLVGTVIVGGVTAFFGYISTLISTLFTHQGGITK